MDLLGRSVFVDPPDQRQRLWAVDVAVRCPAVTAVIADGRHWNMAATRRLQLAAREGGALVLLGRDGSETGQLSAAATRWRVLPMVTAGKRPRWQVQLLRCKGVQPSAHTEGSPLWSLEWNHEKGTVNIPADVADRPAEAARSIA